MWPELTLVTAYLHEWNMLTDGPMYYYYSSDEWDTIVLVSQRW